MIRWKRVVFWTILLMAVAAAAVAVVDRAVLKPMRDADRCRAQMARIQALCLRPYLEAPEKLAELKLQPGEDVLCALARENGLPLSCLVCPADDEAEITGTPGELAEARLSYATWSPEKLRAWIERGDSFALLLWEKRPNHAGQRYILTGQTWVFRVDERQFQQFHDVTRTLLDGDIPRQRRRELVESLDGLFREILDQNSTKE